MTALAGRYSLERELGRGGMATVYLAQDLKHDRPVALKVLHPELAATLGPERFLREIRLTARLDHPHILPVLDSGATVGQLWYTMPYVRGESLRDRLRREVQLPVEVAVDLTRQVASALDYAHREGVVHRDLKPENILVADAQARVADFGVAKALAGSADEKLTETGMAVGTPTYMSPEQASGGRVDARSDIYALGCVIYEMLAGEPPFTGPNPQAITIKRLTDPVPSIRRVREVVPTGVDRAIARALAKMPADRYATAGEFVHELMTPPVQEPEAKHRLARPKLRHILVGGALALVILVGIAIPFARARRPALEPRRVVIAPIENRTGDPAHDVVAAMAADWVTRGLLETGLVDVVTPQGPDGASPTREGLARAVGLAEAAAAGSVVVASMYRQNDSLEFHADIIDVNRNEIVRSLATASAPATTPLKAVEALRERLMAGLATVVDPASADRWPRTASQPPTFEAYRGYMDGRATYDRGDPAGAISHYFRAARLDSNFTMPLATATTSLFILDRCATVDSIAEVLGARVGQVAPYDQHMVARKVAECRGDRAAHYREARELLRLNPLSETATVALAQAAAAAGRPREALSLLERLDDEGRAAHGEWRYFSTMAAALHVLGEHPRELEVSERGRQQHREQHFMLWGEARALAALGRIADLQTRLEESLVLPAQTFPTPGSIMLVAAQELEAHGHADAARPVWERAVAWVQRNPHPENLSPARRSIPIAVFYGAGRLAEADSVAQALAKEYPERPESEAWLGFLEARQGKRIEAERIAAQLATRKGPYLRGRHTMGRAAIAAALAQRDSAVMLLQHSLEEGQEYSIELHVNPWFESLRDYTPFETLLQPRD
jgi:tetratricopeptide (TPR) repeat protein